MNPTSPIQPGDDPYCRIVRQPLTDTWLRDRIAALQATLRGYQRQLSGDCPHALAPRALRRRIRELRTSIANYRNDLASL